MMPSQQTDVYDSSGASYVQTILGTELRVGKYCMINGHPCKIKELHRSAPGKHGHAKLRTVGVGIFDNKKRETIHISQHNVMIPIVKLVPNVQCITTADGYKRLLDDGDEDDERDEETSCRRCHDLPSVLSFPITDSEDDLIIPNIGEYVQLCVIVSCGQYKISKVQILPSSSINGDCNKKQSGEQKENGGNDEQITTVLSKKELRKRRKASIKQQC